MDKEIKFEKLTYSIYENINIFKQIFSDDDNVVYKFFKDKVKNKYKYCIIFIKENIDEDILSQKIISPIMKHLIHNNIVNNEVVDYIENEIITLADVQKSNDINKLVGAMLIGKVILLIDEIDEGIIINIKSERIRNIEEPLNEKVIRGPKEGFIESLEVNLGLIRKRIVTSKLKVKVMEIGNLNKVKVSICYIDRIASYELIKEVENRLMGLDANEIVDSYFIEEHIRDQPLSIFKTVGSTERPDVVALKLFQGKIAIICNGSPFVLTVPYLFDEYFKSSEDYYTNYIFASINRILRIMAFFITTSIPAIYLAIVTFHQQLLPTSLLLSIAYSRQKVPFPTVIELIIMLLTFELMREAGERVPSSIGQTVSFVGALVLGEAAVNARIVSAPIVIIVALTAITSFLTPKMSGTLNVIRVLFIIGGAVLGLFAYGIIAIAILNYLISLKSFGVSYMSNMNITDIDSIKNTYLQVPSYYRSDKNK